jgi:signal transduction histidine kinase
VTLIPGCAAKLRRAREAALLIAKQAGSGLTTVLAGADRPSTWRWRTPKEHVGAVTALGALTLTLCIVNVATMHAGPHGSLAQVAPIAKNLPGRTLWQAAVAVAAVIPLALANRYPLLAWRLGWLGLMLVPLVPGHWWGGWPWGPPQVLAVLVAICAAGIRYRRQVLWWMWALTLLPWSLWLYARAADLDGPVSATLLFTAGVITVDSVGLRLRAQRDLAEQARITETERAERAVLEERTRIARELHDVVAHHMSLIAVQAETAPYRIGDLPESARAEFGSMSATAREALADMRRLLGVLRHDQPAGLAPQPQLCDIPALVDAARRAGVAVDFSAPSAFTQVPSAVGICAYRIVQESLSNASQHAPGAAVAVSVGQDRDAVLLRVSNGPGVTASPPHKERGSGHGLTGMRERVALLGGSLTAGWAADGGFTVSAVLPLVGMP